MNSASRKIASGLCVALAVPVALFANFALSRVELFQDAFGFGVIGSPGPNDNFGRAIAVGDFDGDGRDDVAVTDRENAIAADAGVVHVLYFLAGGLSPTQDYVFDYDPATSQSDSEAGDQFGAALAAGDFDGDGYDDLAIGIPLEDATLASASVTDCGAVLVLYGSVTGISFDGASKLLPAFPGDLTGAGFGFALAAGDFDADGFADLAVGSPGADVGAINQAGIVSVYSGSPAGLLGPSRLLHQDASDETGSVSDVSEPFDHFGWALVAGNFNGDTAGAGGPPVMDLAVGAPGEGDATAMTTASGIVHVFYGDAFGVPFSFATDQSFNQANTATGQSVESGDGFGSSLAAGDVIGRDRNDEIVIGAPYEDVVSGATNHSDAGAVTVVRGAFPFVAVASGAVTFTEDSFAIGENAEAGDFFGWALTVADVDGDGLAEVFVGSPFEDVVDPFTFETRIDAGAVTMVPGWLTSFPSSTSPPRLIAQRLGGHRGTLGVGDDYGRALGAGDFDGDGHADLAVGSPGEGALDESGNAISHVGALYVLYGTLFSDGFETGNVTYW